MHLHAIDVPYAEVFMHAFSLATLRSPDWDSRWTKRLLTLLLSFNRSFTFV